MYRPIISSFSDMKRASNPLELAGNTYGGKSGCDRIIKSMNIRM